MTTISSLSQLDSYQKLSGLCFVLAKVINIIALVLIFAGLADVSFRYTGGVFLTIGGVLLILCMFFAGISYSKEREKITEKKNMIDDLLSDPEVYKEIVNRINK